jgi:mannose-6-phosphate isomerase-like protein (cupin superfamily)
VTNSKINLDQKFALVSDLWRPKVLAELNGQEVKLVKIKGAFPWHHHLKEDEMFLVWKGHIRLEFRDHVVALGPGEALVVPRGVEHRPVADEEAEILLFEPAKVRNTGNVVDETFTAPERATI